MAKESALYQLMDVRMNGVMNDITNNDREYQEIIRKSDEYSGALDKMELPKEVRRLIDGYVSEQNALGSRYGMLAYLLGFSDCKAVDQSPFFPVQSAHPYYGLNHLILQQGQKYWYFTSKTGCFKLWEIYSANS